MSADEILLLLIEDDADHRALVMRHLKRSTARFRVIPAECLGDGLEQLRQVPVQGILLDLRLPDSSWPESLERVCAAAPQSAVVVLSSLEDQELAVSAVQNGAQDYLVKSHLTSELLLRSIRYAIERKRHEASLEQLVAARTWELQETNQRLAREIQEHKQAREQLAEQQQRLLQSERLAAIGEMVAGLAHESRNALQRTQACLTMLARRVEDRPKAMDLVHRIQQAQDDLALLYDRVRQYAGPVHLERQWLQLDELLEQVWNDLGVVRQNREAVLRIATPSDSNCFADRIALRQVFHNVLENSLAACSDPVDIRITCQDVRVEGHPALRISIRDNGPGFRVNDRARLFEAFFTTKTRGTGLGLAISKRLIEAHGGEIRAQDHAVPNETGAEIMITLPRGDGIA